MKILGVLVCLTGAAFARPDVSHLGGGGGYNYNSPSSGFGSSSQPSGSYLPGGGASSFGPSFSGSNLASGISQPSGSYIPQGNLGGGSLQGGGFNPNLVQDQKHVYFYAAPDDEPQARLRIQVASAGQKNTKIIFIKAPSYGPAIPEVIAPPSQSEDKTLVYVLVKKPEQTGDINIPASAGVKQAKPEVYFIKYKTQQDAERSVSSSLGGQPSGSNVQSLNDQREFVNALADPHRDHGSGVGDSFGGGLSPGFGGSLGSSLGPLGSGSSGSGSLGSLGGGSLGSFGSGSSGNKYGTPGESGPY